MGTNRTDIDDALYQRIQDDLVDSFDEELEMEVDDQVLDARDRPRRGARPARRRSTATATSASCSGCSASW
jgi:hypothetical protein